MEDLRGRVISVLDKGFVQLVDYMGSDLTTVNAARVSFGKRKKKITSKDHKLIAYLAEHKHESPFRHISVQLHIKAPEFVARQAMKHIVGIETTSNNRYHDLPWNEISSRYVEMEDEFYRPEKMRIQNPDNKQASIDTEPDDSLGCHKIYNKTIDYSYESYKLLLEKGVAKEIARNVLPVSFYTEWYWTMSLQSATHFISLREKSGAQKEIRVYAEAIKELVRPIAPLSFDALLGS